MSKYEVEVTMVYRVVVEDDDTGGALVAAIADVNAGSQAHSVDARVISEVGAHDTDPRYNND